MSDLCITIDSAGECRGLSETAFAACVANRVFPVIIWLRRPTPEQRELALAKMRVFPERTELFAVAPERIDSLVVCLERARVTMEHNPDVRDEDGDDEADSSLILGMSDAIRTLAKHGGLFSHGDYWETVRTLRTA